MTLTNRIEINRRVMLGKPVIRGTRIPVEPFEFEHRIIRPDGDVRTLYSKGRVVQDEFGRSVRMLGTGQDITERKRLEEQLQQAQKMEAVGQLAGGIAHDFNNLLTAILGYSDLLLDALPQHDQRRQDVEEIEKASRSAESLTRQLLAFSRKQILEPVVLDLNILVDHVDDLLHRLIGDDIQVVTPMPTPTRVRLRARASCLG